MNGLDSSVQVLVGKCLSLCSVVNTIRMQFLFNDKFTLNTLGYCKYVLVIKVPPSAF